MNVNSVDLDINNYDIEDLQHFLNLKDNFVEEDINVSIDLLHNKIMKYDNIDFRNKFILFIKNAKNLLLNHIRITNESIERAKINRNIITHDDKNFVYSNPSQFYKGTINPLNTRVTHMYISIDSKFRENFYTTTSSDFYIYLPSKIKNVVSMQITSFELPISFYGISATHGNNYFTISITDINNNVFVRDILIPDGNYTAFSLVKFLNNLLCPIDASGNMIYPDDLFSYISFSVNIDENDGTGTGKTTVVTDNYNITSFKLDFSYKINCGKNSQEYPTSRFGQVLGFIKDIYDSEILYTSESVTDVFPSRYVYLSIDDYNNNFSYLFMPVYKQATTFSSTIIAKIPINTNFFTLINENDLKIITDERQYFGPVDIDRLRITLLDEYGNILDINNANYSFCILVKKIYDL